MPRRLSIRCSDTGASSKENGKLGPMRTAWAYAVERQVSLTDPETRVTATGASNDGPVGGDAPRAACGDTRFLVIRGVARWRGQLGSAQPDGADRPGRVLARQDARPRRTTALAAVS